jgi:hypothetical protein
VGLFPAVLADSLPAGEADGVSAGFQRLMAWSQSPFLVGSLSAAWPKDNKKSRWSQNQRQFWVREPFRFFNGARWNVGHLVN